MLPEGEYLRHFVKILAALRANQRRGHRSQTICIAIQGRSDGYWLFTSRVLQATPLGPLRGKVHLVVGTDDTFYLDGAAHSLESALTRLGGDPHFTFLPGRSHFNIYVVGDDHWALSDQIAAQMYRVARPGAGRN